MARLSLQSSTNMKHNKRTWTGFSVFLGGETVDVGDQNEHSFAMLTSQMKIQM